ncbi:MAG: hypothetical protein Tsb009_24380 [Planctomycetaceae bacterium]
MILGTVFVEPLAAGKKSPPTDNSTSKRDQLENRWSQSPQWKTGHRFYRGNYPPTSGRDSIVGFYLNWRYWVPVLAMFFLWVRVSYWVNMDSRALRCRTFFWNSIIFLTGVAAFSLTFLMPNFPLAIILLILSTMIPLGFYIQERNSYVSKAGRVLTRQHLQEVGSRIMARVTHRLGWGTPSKARSGPPIQFFGKSVTRIQHGRQSSSAESSKGYWTARQLVYDAIQRRATDIHIEPKENEFSVRLRIDGVMYPSEPMDRTLGEMVCNVFKVLAALDITQKRLAQGGSFRGRLDDRDVDFRISTQGTHDGEKLSLRILDRSNAVSSLSDLGLRKQLLETLQKHLQRNHGMLLSCGPTGSGKSTTLCAAVRSLETTRKNIITLEDPIEFQIENVNQIEINEKSGQTFESSLRNILRQDPDVIMVGEIRDRETAKLACQAASTGHLVLSTVHANEPATALTRLLELGVEPFVVADCVTGVLGQRLLRRLCPECRESYTPSDEELKLVGLPREKVDRIYRSCNDLNNSCEECGGLGFKGRIGVFEFMEVTSRLKELIRQKASVESIRETAREEGMLYMREEGLRMIALGITSLDELLRVVD